MNERLPETPRIKADLMFEGVRYTPVLTEAMAYATPNFYPYRFGPGEEDPTGAGKAAIPYLLQFADGTLVRIKGNGRSPWHVSPSASGGHGLWRGDACVLQDVSFDPRPGWADRLAGDGTPLSAVGVEFHGEMLVVNVTPGCQYFLERGAGGETLRCTFCGYGRPDERMARLGQDIRAVGIADHAYARLGGALRAARAEGRMRQVYLVGGSMSDWADEARRYLELARFARDAVEDSAYVALGSGALPPETLRAFRDEGLVDGVCFNLEVWGRDLFRSVCPGKDRFVGWDRWLRSLYTAADTWGPDHVFTAMVAGIELEPEHGGMSVEAAVDNALEACKELLDHGVTPLWSIYWPLWGADHPERMRDLRRYFEELNIAYAALRRARGHRVNPQFLSHRSAYMQLEADLDRAGG